MKIVSFAIARIQQFVNNVTSTLYSPEQTVRGFVMMDTSRRTEFVPNVLIIAQLVIVQITVTAVLMAINSRTANV